MSATLTQTAYDEHATPQTGRRMPRVDSVDALRGLVMFAMIFVNDLAGAAHVPAWMKHYRGDSGITFVDLVFPAFLFIVGLSIPLAMSGRLSRGESALKVLGHVLLRTAALLAIGVMMVNSTLNPSREKMGWSPTAWTVFMYMSALLAFCSFSPPGARGATDGRPEFWRRVTLALRLIGLTLLLLLALSFRATNGRHLLQLHPFFLRHAWWGILGVIGWAYLVASVVYLLVRNRRTGLLACTALVMCLYPAGPLFDRFWIAHHINIPSALGSHAAIAVAGVLLGSILVTPDTATRGARLRFAVLFIAGSAAAAILLTPQWGVSKERGTPAWCFWACAITAALWLGFYVVREAPRGRSILKPLTVAGRNVLLAYLLSEMLESVLDLMRLSGAYARLAEPNLAHAVARSAGCAIVILAITAAANRVGFSLKL